MSARFRTGWLHGLTISVFAVLLAGTLTAAYFTRHAVENQEREILQQRAGEAAILVSNVIGHTKASLNTLAVAAQVSAGDPVVFNRAVGEMRTFRTAVLLEAGGSSPVVLAGGNGAVDLSGDPAQAVRLARTAADLVPTPVMKVAGERRVGFALPVPGSTMVVYTEWTLSGRDRQPTLAATEPFGELNAVLYAGLPADPEQVVMTFGARPEGRQATHSVPAGTVNWLLAVSARRPLIGSLAENTPWLFLLGGLSTAIVIAGLVEVLLRRRTYAWGLVEERTADLREAALHDALTNLPNRTLLVDRLGLALARRRRSDRGVALLFLDLDRFKVLNDSRGHAVGDEVLITVADRLRHVVRPSDTVARFGGDEFVIVCDDVDGVGEATDLAERIVRALEVPFGVESGEVFLTASVGISMAGAGDRAEELLRDADAAMYRAKERGRSRIEFFDEAMRTEAHLRLEIQNALHRAMERDELRLHYQPVVDLATGEVVGAEALLRWAHPAQGMLPPALFVPMAEELGLIVPIGTWAFAEAARQWARWQQSGPGRRPLHVAVNLSTRQLREPSLVDDFRAIIVETGIDPAYVCLELTESVLMEDIESYVAPLRELKALGLRLAVDDFGTGHASLSYLRRFPFDVLKIDRSFVRGLGRNPADRAIVGSVIEMAHALGLQVVAEGIEDHEHLAELRALGCDLAQGYYFARPLPADAMADLAAPSEAAAPLV